MLERRRPLTPPIAETSSYPVQIPEAQRNLFRQVLGLFEQKKISYAVAGAFALREHTGIHRDTKDLDAFLTPENAALALRYLREEGFECEVCDPVWLYKAHRGAFYVDLITGMSNAVIVVEDSWISRAQPAVVDGTPTRVLAAEELLVSKLFVTRHERFDGADIAHIVYAVGNRLDWPRVFGLVGEHWELLLWALIFFRYVYPAETHCVPTEVWQSLIVRFQDVIDRADPHTQFRGSLIDDKMFAVDVKDWGKENLLLEYRLRRLKTIPDVR
jgi:hypothetical protein